MFRTTAEEIVVEIPVGEVALQGNLEVPPGARGLVLFAHGSGSSRHSPRNRLVADALRESGFGTLLMDLLTPGEEAVYRSTAHLRFDIDLLAKRLEAATLWGRQQKDLRDLPVGFFGASTGAGAALTAAANRPDWVRAVVSRGGRPDLAGSALRRVTAPTLLIVGGEDTAVLELNVEALAVIPAKKRLDVIPRATHLFEEPGALERVAQLAGELFLAHVKRY